MRGLEIIKSFSICAELHLEAPNCTWRLPLKVGELSQKRRKQYADARGLSEEEFATLAQIDDMRRYHVGERLVADTNRVANVVGNLSSRTTINQSNYSILSNLSFAPKIVAAIRLKFGSLFPESVPDGAKGLQMGLVAGILLTWISIFASGVLR